MTIPEIKRELMEESPWCFFCGSTQKPLDLAHLIRRSYSAVHRENPLNCVIACRRCHDIFDNNPSCRPSLPGFNRAMSRIKDIDELYYNQIYDKWMSFKL